jgi:formamidopyrimidine-DNA glycosylase
MGGEESFPRAMPELPEVEFAARQLQDWMVGRRVVRAVIEASHVLRGASPRAIARSLEGKRLASVRRRGKYLLLAFEGGAGALLHLGMTGKLVRRRAGAEEPYSRARFELDDGFAVHLRDPRKFGRLAAGPVAELQRREELSGLGPDAKDPPIGPEALAERLGRTHRPVKVALMDQRVLAGLGNLHAAEALHRAGVSPRRPSDRLRRDELERLAAGIAEAIAFALDQMPAGDAELEYVEEPGAPNPFLVYGRAGEPCRRCGGAVRSFPQGGRTTFYCPRCQR